MLITGATGFIGSAFLKLALKKGWKVRATTRNPNCLQPQVGLEWVEGDLACIQDWKSVLKDVQVVVHLAAELKDPARMYLVNVQGSKHLLQAAVAAGVKRWVQLSSVGAFGHVQEGLVTESWPDNPSGPYEVSKTKFDELLKRAARSHLIEVCIVRPSNVYGLGMRNKSILQIISAIRKGFFAFIGPEGGSANYVHVFDVAQALHLCVQKAQAANQTYIVSAWSSMEQMANSLAVGAGLPMPTRRIHMQSAKVLAHFFKWIPLWPLTTSRVQAMTLRSSYSTQKIEAELGWSVTVPVESGMYLFARNSRP